MKCCKCNQEKSESEMLKKGNVCKECNNIYMKAYRDERKKCPVYLAKEQQRQKDWWEKNRERGNERQRNYRKGNENHKLSAALRSRVKYALLGCVKSDKTFNLLGCTPNEWKKYLEERFDENMNWDNYGTYWEVDHIIPVSHFDLNDPEEQKKAFHFSNTQPLEWGKNRSKGNRFIG